MDEMTAGYERDQARSGRMRVLRDALQACEDAGDLRGENLSDGLRLREWAQKQMDQVVGAWN